MTATCSEVLQPLLQCIPIGCAGQSASPCLRRLEQAFFESCSAAGFEYARFSCWSSFIGDDGQPVHAYSINLSSFPPAWEAHYEQGELYRIDPVITLIQQQADQPLACGSWQRAHQHGLDHPVGNTAAERKQYQRTVQTLFEQAAGHGLRHGAFLSSKDTGRHVLMSVASNSTQVPGDTGESLWQTLFAIAQLLNQSIALTRHCQRCVLPMRVDGEHPLAITPAQARTLQLFLQHPGAPIKEIARLFGASTEAIHFHLKTLRRQLGKPGMSGYALAQFAREHHLV